MNHTPWTKKDSSFPSDRIRPTYRSSTPPSKQSKGKGSAKEKEPPKSKAVRRLEGLVNGLKTSAGKQKDPKGGCFCQARSHDLSTFTPICRACGLILCTVNLPYYACPHCTSPLLTPSAISSLATHLEDEIGETIAKEIEAREKAIEEARRAAGAFPSLSGSSSPASSLLALPQSDSSVRSANQTHKVLSLNQKTKRVTVSSYTSTPAHSRPQSVKEEEDEEPSRMPAPPSEVEYVRGKADPSRPWADLRGDVVGPVYVAVPVMETNEGGSKVRHRSKKKKAPEPN
ncbi:hypothetical protein JAAARDRAFT_42030 [Jaapia argillacea MUCL 33604]|uniref:TRIP4/RQT4 C2HC5-type zinc finger domain-containing protein n=1 Tax=Jaapia argillacea MUCL 33604 TaxID=933084 RepID=A0A067P9A7_9AGAM|nr:hypothetical protein JAAARDRAFT_42030 [Jaapia argillacea MUCL 33604]